MGTPSSPADGKPPTLKEPAVLPPNSRGGFTSSVNQLEVEILQGASQGMGAQGHSVESVSKSWAMLESLADSSGPRRNLFRTVMGILRPALFSDVSVGRGGQAMPQCILAEQRRIALEKEREEANVCARRCSPMWSPKPANVVLLAPSPYAPMPALQDLRSRVGQLQADTLALTGRCTSLYGKLISQAEHWAAVARTHGDVSAALEARDATITELRARASSLEKEAEEIREAGMVEREQLSEQYTRALWHTQEAQKQLRAQMTVCVPTVEYEALLMKHDKLHDQHRALQAQHAKEAREARVNAVQLVKVQADLGRRTNAMREMAVTRTPRPEWNRIHAAVEDVRPARGLHRSLAAAPAVDVTIDDAKGAVTSSGGTAERVAYMVEEVREAWAEVQLRALHRAVSSRFIPGVGTKTLALGLPSYLKHDAMVPNWCATA